MGKASVNSENPRNENKSKRLDGERIPIQLLVDYKADGSYLFDFCKDLGAGGVFIESKTPRKIGTLLELTFTIPDSKETITTVGRVIWVQEPIPTRKNLTPGMGVQFEAMSEEFRKTLAEFVKRYSVRKIA